ncbi:MAG: hypothetical protein JWP89_4213 [Schlesneria sp.]|nr:hypothetical protein [Schlesneria sp.]
MTAADLHRWIESYNWDDGLAPMWPIVDSPQTEYATALLIYWRLDGPWLTSEPGDVNSEAKTLQDRLRSRLLSGQYTVGSCHFDPTEELSQVQIIKLRKAGLPEVLLGSVSHR